MAARTKQQRAPGGGRKPKGEFAKLGSPSSIRLPPEMRDQLEAAAQRSGRSLSQEMLARLDSSLNRDRNKAVDPAMRALCFLISSLARSIHWNKPNWRADPFLFRAIKIGIGKLLDALEPGGEMKLPGFWRACVDYWDGSGENEVLAKARDVLLAGIIPAIQSPEAMADYAVRETLQKYVSPRPQGLEVLEVLKVVASVPEYKEIGGKILKHQEDLYYGMKDARNDLRIKGEKS